MLTQLNPALWLRTPKGVGLCHFVIDYSCESDLIWVVADDATGEIWAWPNPDVRFVPNVSLGAPRQSDIACLGCRAAAGTMHNPGCPQAEADRKFVEADV